MKMAKLFACVHIVLMLLLLLLVGWSTPIQGREHDDDDQRDRSEMLYGPVSQLRRQLHRKNPLSANFADTYSSMPLERQLRRKDPQQQQHQHQHLSRKILTEPVPANMEVDEPDVVARLPPPLKIDDHYSDSLESELKEIRQTLNTLMNYFEFTNRIISDKMEKTEGMLVNFYFVMEKSLNNMDKYDDADDDDDDYRFHIIHCFL